MRKKLFTFLLSIVASVGAMLSQNVQIGDLYYDLNDFDQTASVVGSSKTSGDLIIPASVTYNDVEYTVLSIEDGAFEEYSSLTSVTIGNSVTVIGYRSFWGCTGLTSIEIPNSVTWIGSAAFQECRSLISVTIPNSVTYIGGGAFDGILNVDYSGTATGSPWGARTINGYVDGYIIYSDSTKVTLLACSSLAQGEIIIPNSVTKIGDNAFRGCSNLTSISISNNVTSIGSYAFSQCEKLSYITIPASVNRIGEYAFSNCPYLMNINIESVIPPTITNTSFSSNCLILVPLGTLANYRNNTSWNSYRVHVLPLAVSTNNIGATDATFEISDSSNSGKIISCGIEDGEEFKGNIVAYIGLEPDSEYANVPFFIRTPEGDYDTIQYSFTTTALELTTKPSKPVSSTTAILLAETNISDAEVNCGFEYKRNDAPADMDGTKVFCPVASGQMAGRLKNLNDQVYYKYRAFYQSAAGNMYYGEWQYIFTGDNAIEFDPILYTYSATVVTENEATLSGYALAGSEDFTEQGFEYWAESRANNSANAPRRISAGLNEHLFAQASGIKMTVTLTDLDAGTVYKYRAYGKVGSQYYYGTEQTFTTQGEWVEPTIEMGIENIQKEDVQSTKAQKILRDGHIFILRGGKTYTIQGQEVK